MNQIPVMPMVRILKQYAQAHNLPLDPKSWESIVRCYAKYERDAQIKN